MNLTRSLAAWFALAIFVPAAHADYTALEDIQTVGDGTFSYDGCFYLTTAVSGSCSLSHSDSAFVFSADVTSFGDRSGLHAVASASISTISAGYVIAEAQEVLKDTLRFNAPIGTLGYVSMTLTADGTYSGGNTPGLIPNVPPGVGYGSSTLTLNNNNSPCSFYNTGRCTVVVAVDYSNPLMIDAFLSANAFPSAANGGDTRFADFQNTGFISSLRLTHLNGNPLALSHISSSGLQYPMVPEPASCALMWGGLGLIGFLMRGRRGQAQANHGRKRARQSQRRHSTWPRSIAAAAG